MFVFAIVLAILAIDSIVASPLNRNQSDSDSRNSIVGKWALPGQFAYQAMVVDLENQKRLCSGAIISRRWIVRIAHIIGTTYANTSHIGASIGTTNFNSVGPIVRLSQIVTHPNYTGPESFLEFDITLLKTARTLEFGLTVRPIPLKRQHVDDDKRSIVTGWGIRAVK